MDDGAAETGGPRKPILQAGHRLSSMGDSAAGRAAGTPHWSCEEFREQMDPSDAEPRASEEALLKGPAAGACPRVQAASGLGERGWGEGAMDAAWRIEANGK